MHREKRKIHVSGGGKFFLISLALSLGILLVTSLVMSAIAYSSPDPTGKIGIYSLVSLIVSAAVSGFLISRLSGSGSVGMAALTSLATVLVLILFGAIASGGKLGVSALMNYLCYFGVALLFSLFGKKRERRHRRR